MNTKTLLHYKFIFVIILLLTALGCKQKKDGKSYLSIPDPKTLGESYVSNPDNILKDETVSSLNQTLQELDASGRAHIDVVVVESIGEAVPKDAATSLFRLWKIGDKETNNGLLILIVKDQHRVEFETGYGLEGDLPDITCYKIQQEHMIPHAKADDLDLAVTDGVAAVIDQLKTGTSAIAGSASTTDSISNSQPIQTSDSVDEPVVAPDNRQDIVEPYGQAHENALVSSLAHSPGDIFTLIIGVIYLIFVIAIDGRLYKRYKYRVISGMFWLTFLVPVMAAVYLNLFYPTRLYNVRTALVLYGALSTYLSLHFLIVGWWVSAGTKSKTRYEQYLALYQKHYNMGWSQWIFPLPFLLIYWRRYTAKMDHLRNDPYPCETCGAVMQKLDENKDDAYIEKGQVAEETAKSVDYDVWACTKDDSHKKLTLVYRNLNSKAVECAKCHYFTLMPDGTEVVVPATTSSAGWGYILSRCHFCDHREQVRYTIPKISTSSSSSSSGSSSSSSSSSSSGGSSGGGGAGSSW